MGDSAERVFRRGEGRYPLLCEPCMLREMIRRSAERVLCESCGRRIESIRRIAIRDMEGHGQSPSRLCLACLRKQLDESATAPYVHPRHGTKRGLYRDDRPPDGSPFIQRTKHKVLCPWCFFSLSSKDITQLVEEGEIHCHDCGATLTPDIL
ncbi:MAG: hypothetical protein ACE5H4_01730 [Candidatus Thorarchaeota archaeon]